MTQFQYIKIETTFEISAQAPTTSVVVAAMSISICLTQSPELLRILYSMNFVRGLASGFSVQTEHVTGVLMDTRWRICLLLCVVHARSSMRCRLTTTNNIHTSLCTKVEREWNRKRNCWRLYLNFRIIRIE